MIRPFARRFSQKNGPERSGPGKNCLPIQKSYSTIGIRRIKGGTWRAGTSPRPYAGDATSHTAEFLRHAHYTGNLPFLQGGKSRCGSVCCIGAVQGSLYPAQPFYSPQPELPGGDGVVPPRGSRLGTPPRLGGKIHRAGRELPEEEAGCLIRCQAAFFFGRAPRKNFQKHKTGGQPSGTQYQRPRKNKKERRT